MFWIIILFLAAVILLLIPYICAQMCFSVRSTGKDEPEIPGGDQYGPQHDKILANITEARALPYEDVYIQSFDGLRLHGKFYAVDDAAPTHILVHGYRSSALLDFGGGLRDVVKSGHNALLIDQRAHSASEGKYLSFGINESRDVIDWIEYINRRQGMDKSVIIEGVSMGAATVLMTVELGLPENVIGILADSPYTDPEEIIRFVMKRDGFPQFLFPLLRLGGRLYCGFDISSRSPRENMKKCKVPVFFIHGDEDRFVPYEMGVENYEVCTAKKFFFTGHGAGHVLSYLVDREGYRKAHDEFMAEILK